MWQRPTLKRGSTGKYVKRLQLALRRRGLFPYVVTGYYGSKTAKAVKKLQAKSNITPVDGICGPKTWRALTKPYPLERPKPADPFQQATEISDKGVAFIASFEGFFPNVYNDPVGHCTIGYGTLLHLGNCTAKDREQWGTITKEKARELMHEELDPMVASIVKHTKPRLKQQELDALASFAYNVGIGGLLGSTLLKKLNSFDREGAAQEFLKWDKAGNPPRPLPGLTRRRKAEMEMFKDGIYRNND